jgi:hypothetical protein
MRVFQQNLETLRGSAREETTQQKPVVDSLEAALAIASASSKKSSSSSSQYRDRAKERRQKYGTDKALLAGLEPRHDQLKQ